MKQTIERELKLDVEPGFRLPTLPGRPLAPRAFVSRYHDTPDHRLARHGITLHVSLLDAAARGFKKLRKAVRALPEVPSNEALHGVRIRAKRARYAAELVVSEAGRHAERFVKRLKKLQDVLGEHQDAAFAEMRLRELGAGAPGSRSDFVAGLLCERQRARRVAARAAPGAFWPKVAAQGAMAWR
jgi:CHAD domain-containing protein